MKPQKITAPTLFIDPGIRGTGWAVFHPRGGVVYDVIPWKHTKTLIESCEYIAAQLRNIEVENCPVHIIIEFPEYWQNAKSHAATQRGDLHKLCFLCGYLAANYSSHFLTLIKPREWKGQLPKDVVIKRLIKIDPVFKNIPNHAADAVGMGYAWQGLL